MNFRESLARHLDAIKARDLPALADTLSDQLVLVTAEGQVIGGADRFLALHREWFLMPGWQFDTKLIETFEVEDLGVATLQLAYREPGKAPAPSVLTLAFRRTEGRWLMVLDQNTPVRAQG